MIKDLTTSVTGRPKVSQSDRPSVRSSAGQSVSQSVSQSVRFRSFFWLITWLIFLSLLQENIGVNNPNLFEGDMILTAAQRMALELGTGRAAIKGKEWPKGVMVYAIDKKFGKLNSITVPQKNLYWVWQSGQESFEIKWCDWNLGLRQHWHSW